MPQTSVTDYFSIRTQKRKYAPDGEPVVRKSKTLLLDKGGAVTPVHRAVVQPGPKPKSKVVSKLSFDGDDKNPPPPNNNTDVSRKELSLGQVKKALASSSRLDELKARMASFNKNYDKLKALKTPEKVKTPEKSTLKEFQSIELVVPASPSKRVHVEPTNVLMSPVKEPRSASDSPLKSPLKVPAYLRFASLTEATPSLTLPHHYRWLAEVFRAIETAASILHNRKETITFTKLKPAAQEMLKRNVTEKHLSQIQHLCPRMYSFTREKLRNFGSTAKKDEYELILKPLITNQVSGSPIDVLNPEALLERRRSFYNLLIEKVKGHHDVFLNSLDPPLSIPRSKLARWHPEFDLERIPDIECDELPKMPNVEKYTTAQDVLSRAKDMFNNPRIQKALLQRLEDKKNETVQTERPADEPKLINPALKNIPSALLQKVKARQAEKALKTMTSTHTEDSIAHQKLPDLARTLRNLFLAEKKSILSVEAIVPHLENSFNGVVSNVDLVKHLKMLSTEVPEFLTFVTVRKCDYIRLTKIADFTKIIQKLEVLAKKHDLS